MTRTPVWSGKRTGRGRCWCGRNGAAMVEWVSLDGSMATGPLPACADHLQPARWPAEIHEAMAEEVRAVVETWYVDCPVCGQRHDTKDECGSPRAN